MPSAAADKAYEEHRARQADRSRLYLDRRQKGALFGKFKTGGSGYCLKKAVFHRKLNDNKGKLAAYLKRICGRDLRPELEGDLEGKLSVSDFISLLDYKKPKDTTETVAASPDRSAQSTASQPLPLPSSSSLSSSVAETTAPEVKPNRPDVNATTKSDNAQSEEEQALATARENEAKILAAMQVLLPAAVRAVANKRPQQAQPRDAQGASKPRPLVGSMDKLELDLSLAELKALLPYVKRPFNRRIVSGGIQQLTSALSLMPMATNVGQPESTSGETAATSEKSAVKATACASQSAPNGHETTGSQQKKKKVPWESRAVRRAKKAAAAAAAAAEAAEAEAAEAAQASEEDLAMAAAAAAAVAVSASNADSLPPTSAQRELQKEDVAPSLASVEGHMCSTGNPATGGDLSASVVENPELATDAPSTDSAALEPPKGLHSQPSRKLEESSNAPVMQQEQFFCCRMCRAALFPLSAVVHGKDSSKKQCDSLFLDEPRPWMPLTHDGGQQQVKIQCPGNPNKRGRKCDARLGLVKWYGSSCSCREWVTPGIQIIKSKVDPKFGTFPHQQR